MSGCSGSSGAICPRPYHAQKAKMSPFLVGGPLANGAAGSGPVRSAPRPSASRFPQDIANIRRRACHHCGSELVSFARARIDESFLSFAHKGIDGAGYTVIPGAIAITPADWARLTAIVCCSQHAKEIRLRGGFGELRRQVSQAQWQSTGCTSQVSWVRSSLSLPSIFAS